MLDVFYTVDVEVWCGGWKDIDNKFPSAFRQYVYGKTASGDYGLPYQLKLLNDHNLKGVFFVEPLFAARFGEQALAEIVGLIRDAGQEVQLHMHTEWVDEAIVPLLDGVQSKRQHMRYFSLAEQTTLIAKGLQFLRVAGAADINAFRAGSFACNADTLSALSANNITFDSSYNASYFGPTTGICPGLQLTDPMHTLGLYEYPMTVFRDGTRSLRHAQLAACSSGELEALMWQALEAKRGTFVMLSHNFELLNQTRDRPDKIVVRRFQKLCEFLDKNRDSFCTKGFKDLEPQSFSEQPEPLTSPIWRTGLRMVEQAYSRIY